ncbi:uncharacterized protein LOC121390689 [Gigantopelta aegis]|uniref:uncharacterized protein LOC121390689 n=1 Tax=Gigantopelta aegis TaxID=1735272 RepID=UPI001B88C9D4|nr:uncharacterized protein LOC121390689 [Gigantopelta aegis]
MALFPQFIAFLLYSITRLFADNNVVIETGNKCSYFYDYRLPTVQSGLVNCSWYAPSACCKRTEVTSVFSKMYPLYKSTTSCKNHMNYLMCYFCSPDQHHWYKEKLSVCLDFCEALYEECKTASYNGESLSDYYPNGTAFCEAQNYKVVDGSNCFKFDPNVFSFSEIVTYNTLVVVAEVIFVIVVL